MAKVTTKPEEEQAAPGRSVSALSAELDAARAEHARLKERAGGEIGRWVTRREARTYVTQTGHPATAMVDTSVWETEQVGPIERLRARRQLPALVERMSILEEELLAAKAEAEQAARTQRTRGIAAGEAELRRALPEMLAAVEQARALVQGFNQTLRRLDAATGDAYFSTQLACPMFEDGQVVAGWLAFVRNAVPEARR